MEVAPYSAVIKILKDAEFKAVQNRIVELARAGDVRSLQAFMKERGPDSDLLPGCSVDAVSSSAKRTALMVAAQAGKVGCAQARAGMLLSCPRFVSTGSAASYSVERTFARNC